MEPGCRLIVAEAGLIGTDRPGLDAAALGCRGDNLAVGADGHAVDRAVSTGIVGGLERILTHSLGRVHDGQARMDATGLIFQIAGDQQPVPVREKSNSGDRSHPAPPGDHFGIGGGVPDFDGLIGTGGCQPPAVGTERHARNVLLVPAQRERVQATRGFPDLDGAIGPAGGDPASVGAELDVENPILVTPQRLPQFAAATRPKA